MRRRYMAEILPIRRKTLSNQSINATRKYETRFSMIDWTVLRRIGNISAMQR